MLYLKKVGQEDTNNMMPSLVEVSIKGLSYVVNIDNEEELKNDLINNKYFCMKFGRQAAEINEDTIEFMKFMFIAYKHFSFSISKISAVVSTISTTASTISTATITIFSKFSTIFSTKSANSAEIQQISAPASTISAEK